MSAQLLSNENKAYNPLQLPLNAICSQNWIFFKLMRAACSNRLVNFQPKPADDVVRRITSGISNDNSTLLQDQDLG